MFSDSMTTIVWIRDWRRKFKTYENFRLKRIRLLSRESEWRYVPTHENPADYSSKGLQATDTKKWLIFHNGPTFLLSPQDSWPQEPVPGEKKAEKAAVKIIASLATICPLELTQENGTLEEPEIEYTTEKTPWPLQATEKIEGWSLKIRRVGIITKTLLKLRESVQSRSNKSAEAPHDSDQRYNLRSNNKPRTEQKNKETNEIAHKKISLTLKEKEKAEVLIIKAIQAMHFHKEIITLLKLGVFTENCYEGLKNRDSKLIALSPFIDETGIMRVGGRLGNSKTLPYESRHPIILPKLDTEAIQSLIRHHHRKNFHCSQTETFFTLRQKYFFLGGRNTVKKVISKCVECQTASKQPQPQRMGELPMERVTIAAPFSSSGMDVFGEFTVKHSGRGTKKRWVLLITCLVTRAVALYPLPDMTLSSVINAILKMNAQFPTLRKIVSDNGSNFKGAYREIREARQAWNEQEAVDKLGDVGIEWTFGPAYCGSWGGVWERMVGIVKNSFKACIGNEILDTDSFDALCCGISGVINRRPLTRASDSLEEMTILSPAHFLYPYNYISSSTTFLPPIPDRGDFLRSTWRILRSTLDNFWDTFQKSYLCLLAQRQKWKKSSTPLRVGDVVLVSEPITPRERWKLGLITEIISKEIETPRTFRLRDAFGNFFVRHRTSLIKLEMGGFSDLENSNE